MRSNKTALVSIIVPCYNQAEFLPDALDSVLAQTYPHWECVVVNDASPDNTREVAMAYRQRDSRIRLVELPENGGLAMARNRGIALSGGEYILPLDADDRLDPCFLEKTVPLLSRQESLKVVYTDAVYFGAVEQRVHRPDFDKTLLSNENIFQPCALFRRTAFYQTKGYRQQLYGYEDWDLWLQMIGDAREVLHLAEPLFYYRVKNESMLLALQGDAGLEQQVRRRIYRGNRKKIQEWNPALAYYFEKQQLPGDWLFKLRYRLSNLRRCLATTS